MAALLPVGLYSSGDEVAEPVSEVATRPCLVNAAGRIPVVVAAFRPCLTKCPIVRQPVRSRICALVRATLTRVRRVAGACQSALRRLSGDRHHMVAAILMPSPANPQCVRADYAHFGVVVEDFFFAPVSADVGGRRSTVNKVGHGPSRLSSSGVV
jgi:hypothetical protein